VDLRDDLGLQACGPAPVDDPVDDAPSALAMVISASFASKRCAMSGNCAVVPTTCMPSIIWPTFSGSSSTNTTARSQIGAFVEFLQQHRATGTGADQDSPGRRRRRTLLPPPPVSIEPPHAADAEDAEDTQGGIADGDAGRIISSRTQGM